MIWKLKCNKEFRLKQSSFKNLRNISMELIERISILYSRVFPVQIVQPNTINQNIHQLTIWDREKGCPSFIYYIVSPHYTQIAIRPIKIILWNNKYMSHDMIKPTKWVCAQRRLRSAWASESSLSAWRKLGSLATYSVHSEDWLDWVDAQAHLSLRWAHTHFVGFVMSWLIWASSRKNLSSVMCDQVRLKPAAQLQRLVRVLKFWI